MTDSELATNERSPSERKTLEDALTIAIGTIDNQQLVDSDQQYTLAAGFLVLANDMAAMLDAAKKSTHFCGWCERANGDSRLGLVAMPIDEIREHTVRCQHNPLVQEFAELRLRIADLERGSTLHREECR